MSSVAAVGLGRAAVVAGGVVAAVLGGAAVVAGGVVAAVLGGAAVIAGGVVAAVLGRAAVIAGGIVGAVLGGRPAAQRGGGGARISDRCAGEGGDQGRQDQQGENSCASPLKRCLHVDLPHVIGVGVEWFDRPAGTSSKMPPTRSNPQVDMRRTTSPPRHPRRRLTRSAHGGHPAPQ